MTATTTCSLVARELGEPLAGTAPEALGWVLVEARGPWGRDALCDNRTGLDLNAVLAPPPGVRLQAIRRPDRREGPLRVGLAHGGPTPWLTWIELDDLSAIARLDLAATLEPVPVGRAAERPAYLVCTHAQRDVCCAVRGRPLFDELEARGDVEVWETSHTGGHRFAGNVLVLPAGRLYGSLEPDDVAALLHGEETGQVLASHLRGTCALPPPAQAAEALILQTHPEVHADTLEVARTEVADGSGMVELIAPGHRFGVGVEWEASQPRPVSCGAAPVEHGSWRARPRIGHARFEERGGSAQVSPADPPA